MKAFMDEEFMLFSQPASFLYHEYAEKMPIVDYHCHICPKEIWEDKQYENIAQLWLGVGGSNFGDHYKWRFMRSCGVDERFITGNESDYLRFKNWAECLGKAVGNPLYHWSHLELHKYFGYEGILNKDTADMVWKLCNEKLRSSELSVRGIIKQSNVKLICTTDDPADSLEWHIKLANDSSFDCQVIPAMRPDKAKNIENPAFLTYLETLSSVSGIKIDSFNALKAAIHNRMDYFSTLGCKVSDHAFEYVPFAPASEDELERIFSERLCGNTVSKESAQKYAYAFLLFLSKEYCERNWVMQLHYGCKRNNNSLRYNEMGPDTGFDCIGDNAPVSQLTDCLDAMAKNDILPKTIIYSLNPNDNAAIGSVIGCFQDSSIASKLQNGSAWWFNDHIAGMTEQMTSLANLGNLSGFVGMTTDSRSFLSYTRHDYFRRLLCNIIGQWLEDGLFPADYNTLGTVIKGLCFNNAIDYFGFDLEKVL